jgi:hypothetical protein
MIYAKEHPNNSKAILGDSAFNELASRPDLPAQWRRTQLMRGMASPA